MSVITTPRFLDNRREKTLAQALEGVLAQVPETLDIATGFFTPNALAQLLPGLERAGHVRLLLGSEPPALHALVRPEPGENEAAFERRLLAAEVEASSAALIEALGRTPFTPEARAALRRISALASEGRIEVRRYTKRFLHAKAYIYQGPSGEGAVIGSSNLTPSGLSRNLEASVHTGDDSVFHDAQEWFADLWSEGEAFDLAAYLDALIGNIQPYDVYIKILHTLFGGQEAAMEESGLSLMQFQRRGVDRALNIIEKHGGVLIADEVGLGKTYTASGIIEHYTRRRQHVLVVAPAAVQHNWENMLSANTHDLAFDLTTFDKLALDRQIDPANTAKHLPRDISDYQLVVIDEAHNYRNPATPTRAKTLKRLLAGRKRDLVMLSATPVNNSIWDLYYVLGYFVRQDGGLSELGVRSMRDLFRNVAAQDPSELDPDQLQPIIFDTCLKRTRSFVKTYYQNDQFRGPDGTLQTITFPKAVPITVRYDVSGPLPALFDAVEEALDPEVATSMRFSRYNVERFRKGDPDEERVRRNQSAVGLLRSMLLKRFESSAKAFGNTLAKMIGEHETFLSALDGGFVIGTDTLKELSASESISDEEDWKEVLGELQSEDSKLFNVKEMHAEIAEDLRQLRSLFTANAAINEDNNPKLAAIFDAVQEIATRAEAKGVNATQVGLKRKVLLFSYFADTARYLKDQLVRLSDDPSHPLSVYKDRIAMVSGSEGMDVGRAAEAFAPTDGTIGTLDILVATDALAEGVNLQAAQHIINVDVPWNPMRLVQRHGRVDRIGSPHTDDGIYLRTVFPAERLDRLLRLEGRIMSKIAQAAAAIGVQSPIAGMDGRDASFAEQILSVEGEQPTIYQGDHSRTFEEYAELLRRAVETGDCTPELIPDGVGSGIAGDRTGIAFCASVGEKSYLYFVPVDENWKKNGDLLTDWSAVLRKIDCKPEDETVLSGDAEANSAALWPSVVDHIVAEWNRKTDPAQTGSKVDKLNREVIDFLRSSTTLTLDLNIVENAKAILKQRFDHALSKELRSVFDAAKTSDQGAESICDFVTNSGLEKPTAVQILKPIKGSEVRLIAWMSVKAENLDPQA